MNFLMLALCATAFRTRRCSSSPVRPPANLLKAASAALYPKCKAVNFDVSLV
jgi:hypothetical protein